MCFKRSPTFVTVFHFPSFRCELLLLIAIIATISFSVATAILLTIKMRIVLLEDSMKCHEKQGAGNVFAYRCELITLEANHCCSEEITICKP